MSLQGTLETFSLPDVLVLLSSTKKSGELKVVGQRGEGRVWVEKGQIVHCQTNGKETAPVDTVFELLRLDTGTFAFDNDATAPKQNEGQLVDLVLTEAQGRLGEWRDIERVVPHLDAVVDMAPEASGDEVTVSRAQWKLLVAVAGGRDIHTLMARLDQGEFDTCKAVKELVESGMATIDASAPAKAVAKTEAAPIKAEQKQTAAEALAAAAKDNAKGDAAGSEQAAGSKTDAKAEAAKDAGKDAGQDGGKDEESTDVVDQLARARRVRATTAGASEAASDSLAPVNGNGKTKVEAKVANGANSKAEGNDAAANDAGDDDTEALVAQLAALGVDEDDPEAKEKIAARLAAEAAEADGEEPINRGLLLKFLSSVRS